MEASMAKIMALVVIIQMILSPTTALSSTVEEAAAPGNGNRAWCEFKCGVFCSIDRDPAACVAACMKDCMGGKNGFSNADFCTTGCMITTCFDGKPGNYTKDTVKSCVKSCSDGCNKTKPCSP